MRSLILNRLASVIPVLFIVSLVAFLLTFLVPGDPAVALSGENATDAMIERTRERLGLDQPPLVQYWQWLSGILLHFDFGESLFSGGQVTDAILRRLPATLSLTVGAMIMGVAIGIPAGIICAVNQGKPIDRLLTLGTSLGISTPNYVLGLLLVGTLALRFQLFPATGYKSIAEAGVGGWLSHLVLPCITLGLLVAAVVARMLRSSLIGVLEQDYIRMAKSKGMRWNVIIGKHALKNAMVPVVTVIGTQVAFLLGGAVIVEQIFGIQGVGTFAIIAVSSRDIPAVQAVVVFAAVAVLLVNLLVDISYAWFNPRVRSS